MITNEDVHLEEEDIDVETVASDPGVLVQDIAKDWCIGYKDREEHHCKIGAYFVWRVCATINIDAACSGKYANSIVNMFLLCDGNILPIETVGSIISHQKRWDEIQIQTTI